jgi:Domain of unknown function (DUF4395)
MRQLVGFPNPVNEKAARVVAAGVALAGVLILATGWQWLLGLVAFGFWARVITGPKLSPLGRFATSVAAPRLGPPRYVPGPPKRFAQTIGAVVTTVAAACALALGWTTAAAVLTALIVVFAVLESVFAFCVGCKVFAVLMAAGVIPEDVCAECANIRAV